MTDAWDEEHVVAGRMVDSHEYQPYFANIGKNWKYWEKLWWNLYKTEKYIFFTIFDFFYFLFYIYYYYFYTSLVRKEFFFFTCYQTTKALANLFSIYLLLIFL